MRPVRLLLAGCACAMSLAHADDVRVLTAGAFAPVVESVQPVFERATGNHLVVTVDTAGGLRQRVLRGDAFDVVVSTTASLQPMAAAGRLAPAAVQPLARVGVGVGVPRGAPLPDISTVDAFRRSVLQARAVAYVDPASGGTSGIYLDRLFQQWGIAPQVHAKAVLVQGGQAARKLADGSADLAIQQISEIVAVPGAQLVGPLPAAIQQYTVYAGAVSAQTANAQAARELLTALHGPSATEKITSLGMEVP